MEEQSTRRPTKRARAVAKKLLRLAADDPAVTIAEVADALSCTKRNARKWLRRLEAHGLVDCGTLEVGRSHRPTVLNTLRAPPETAT